MTLLERLEQIQKASALSDIKFAARLGITRVSWWNIRTGGREIGPKVLAAVMREFPDLKPFVLDYILESHPDHRDRAATAA